VYTDANIVMGAESADFVFDCWHLCMFIHNLLNVLVQVANNM
jgi:hypothetical protein